MECVTAYFGAVCVEMRTKIPSAHTLVAINKNLYCLTPFAKWISQDYYCVEKRHKQMRQVVNRSKFQSSIFLWAANDSEWNAIDTPNGRSREQEGQRADAPIHPFAMNNNSRAGRVGQSATEKWNFAWHTQLDTQQHKHTHTQSLIRLSSTGVNQTQFDQYWSGHSSKRISSSKPESFSNATWTLTVEYYPSNPLLYRVTITEKGSSTLTIFRIIKLSSSSVPTECRFSQERFREVDTKSMEKFNFLGKFRNTFPKKYAISKVSR